MKAYFVCAVTAASFIVLHPRSASAQQQPTPFVYETSKEFFGTGDFDGDGRTDTVIVDKESGKYRLGYQQKPGSFSWVDCRPGGIKGIAGFTMGNLLDPKKQAVAFTSPDANQITLVDISSPSAPSKPVLVPFTAALGPNTVV